AVACVNDGAAMGVMQELGARGIVVPDDVAVIGFDDIDASRYLDSPLTTVRQPVREQARDAFLVLLARMAGAPRSENQNLPAELVVRESCGCTPYDPDGRLGAAAGGVGAVHRELYEALRGDLLRGGATFLDTFDLAVHAAVERGADVDVYQKVITLLQAS